MLLRVQASICRCAQPLTGVQSKRSEEDELLLEEMRRCNGAGDLPLIIVDTRPKVGWLPVFHADAGHPPFAGPDRLGGVGCRARL